MQNSWNYLEIETEIISRLGSAASECPVCQSSSTFESYCSLCRQSRSRRTDARELLPNIRSEVDKNFRTELLTILILLLIFGVLIASIGVGK